MKRFFRLTVDVGIAEQTLVHPHALPDVEPDYHHVHVGLAASVRAPGKGAVREGDLQPGAVEQGRPELRHLLALGDRVGGDEADTGRTLLHVFSRLEEPGGHVVERSTGLA